MVLRRWLPERPPTWTDVLAGLLILVWLPLNVGDLQTIYLSWFLFGSVAGLVSMGPLANSLIGERTGTWFRKIGVLGRAVSILAFVDIVWFVRGQVDLPGKIVTSAIGGFLLSILVYTLSYILSAGEISGWTR